MSTSEISDFDRWFGAPVEVFGSFGTYPQWFEGKVRNHVRVLPRVKQALNAPGCP
ncbi:hypothetical protein H5410_023985 [Solanum commersonii]|uniref:Uncharacterized protein n=1 Tax=Solanum commersonii TaxID=4109 RepID=A0A9J5ZKQ6_SOLCO|nr:hypothetical protein H5410_023985 [Solanum commersonii]